MSSSVIERTADSMRAGEYGKLGLGDIECHAEPVRVAGTLKKRSVVQVATGSHHTVCVAADGVMFAWGDGESVAARV